MEISALTQAPAAGPGGRESLECESHICKAEGLTPLPTLTSPAAAIDAARYRIPLNIIVGADT